MISAPPGVKIVVAAEPIDFRKGLDGLAAIVQRTLRADPFAGDVFIFRCRRADRLKILFYDGTGLVLIHKRLERDGFFWPSPQKDTVKLSSAQFSMLLEGLDWRRVKPVPVPRPQVAC